MHVSKEMTQEEAMRLLSLGGDGIEVFNLWRAARQREGMDCDVPLRGVSLKGMDLTNASLFSLDLSGEDHSGATFNSANLSGASLEDTTLHGCNFEKSKLENTKFNGASIRRAIFWSSEMDGAKLHNCEIQNCEFNRAAGRIFFEGAKEITESTFYGAGLTHSTFTSVKLSGSDFSNCNLSDCDFRDSDLRKTYSNSQTNVQRCKFEGCRVERFNAERLGIHIRDRIGMKIEDDLAKLRQSYSGFWAILHLFALVGFALPYIWFIVKNWTFAEFGLFEKDGEPILLAIAFFRFILFGEDGWETCTFSFQSLEFLCGFIVMVIFNYLRFRLLKKTKTLELQEIATGVPANFRFDDGPWGDWFRISQWMEKLYFGIVLYHIFLFLAKEIPV
ncbi:MAG: pentapeptide repeat-containing protein [Planctomycetota bacterium]|nr:MAG: pentapeptide repeat-containing protein [Planctomycetota bacterium]